MTGDFEGAEFITFRLHDSVLTAVAGPDKRLGRGVDFLNRLADAFQRLGGYVGFLLLHGDGGVLFRLLRRAGVLPVPVSGSDLRAGLKSGRPDHILPIIHAVFLRVGHLQIQYVSSGSSCRATEKCTSVLQIVSSDSRASLPTSAGSLHSRLRCAKTSLDVFSATSSGRAVMAS